MPDFTASNNDPFAYLKSVVQSLTWAGQGLVYEEKPFDGSWERAVYNLKSAREYYACVGTILAGFVESKDDKIKGTTELILEALDLLRFSNEQVEKELVELLNQAGTRQWPGNGTVSERLATTRHNLDIAWEKLMGSFLMTTYALVTYDDRGRLTHRFRITKVQRQGLKQQLVKEFGPSVRKGLRKEQAYSYFRAATIKMYGFLADPKWRPSDDS